MGPGCESKATDCEGSMGPSGEQVWRLSGGPIAPIQPVTSLLEAPPEKEGSACEAPSSSGSGAIHKSCQPDTCLMVVRSVEGVKCWESNQKTIMRVSARGGSEDRPCVG
eukprot:1263959-Amphidinium_carterae.1